ncbi:hypothetical protein MKX03_004077, partial [Papaver bracteatum]
NPLSRLKCLQKNPRKFDYPNNSSIHLDKQRRSSCLIPSQQNYSLRMFVFFLLSMV